MSYQLFGYDYFTFDSTGTNSAIWRTTMGTGGSLEIHSLSEWQRTGRIVSAAVRRSGAEFLLRLDSGRGAPAALLVRIQIQCDQASCKTNSESRNLTGKTYATQGIDGSLLVRGPGSYRTYASAGEFFAGARLNGGSLTGLPPDPPDTVVATGARRSVLIPRSSKPIFQTEGGFRRIKVIAGNRSYDRTLFVVSTDSGAALHSAALLDGRFLFSVYENPLLG
jgi:hypothetical protein